MFKFLFQNFRAIMDAKVSRLRQDILAYSCIIQDGSMREVAVAIRGYGSLAGPCFLLLGENDLLTMLEDVAQRCDQIYFSNDQAEDNIVQLPNYIDAIGSILHKLTTISETHIILLEKLFVILCDNFSRLGLPQVCLFCYLSISIHAFIHSEMLPTLLSLEYL